MTAEAVLLTLVITLLPGVHPELGRDVARQALEKLGCADSRIVITPGAVPRAHEVRARCVRLEGAEGKETTP